MTESVGELRVGSTGLQGGSLSPTHVSFSSSPTPIHRQAVGPWSDLALHTIGWRAFQDLCAQVCEVILGRPVEVFREAQDGGQDAVFLLSAGKDGDLNIGTVQCKHTSDPRKALGLSELRSEVEHVEQLVAQGQADTYVLMTNMSVDAPVAIKIRAELRRLGVRKPHVIGKQYLVRAIRSSTKLRALVPQVYGLGDITSLLDERLSSQSRALLDQWIPKLKSYVPTTSHRRAVRALTEHGAILLLGNPSSGKSAIGAILATLASDAPSQTVLALTSPQEFEASWNPDDPNRFFWIDDAFGSNVLREDYIENWASAFRKVQAAISRGNKFLFTSRLHIYEAAKRRLGSRNLPLFTNGSAVVDVGALTFEERAQILYNHVNFGHQSQSWKTAAKAHLDAVAAVPNFLPGIAERLGDPNFTKGLHLREASLVRFMEHPREHLIDTINALDPSASAALILVYVHQGAFDEATYDRHAAQAVTELTGIPLPKILEAFDDLKGSFLRRPAPGRTIWGFAHPTIADALTEILRQKPLMVPALLRGATIDTILSGFISEGAGVLTDAMIIPASLNAQLVARLIATPDELQRNWSLFFFLAYRASDDVLRQVVAADSRLLNRRTWQTQLIHNDPRICALAHSHRLRLLPDELRNDVADDLERAALDFDMSFFDDPNLLALLPPTRLLALGLKVRGITLKTLEDKISETSNDADLDEDPSDQFHGLRTSLNNLAEFIDDDEASGLVQLGRRQIEEAIQALTDRIEDHERSRRDNADTEWETVLDSVADNFDTGATTMHTIRPRSIFDDVDQN